MSRHEAASVGWGMTPRGEVGLIVALSALNSEVIRDTLFSVIVVVMVLVSVLPPPLLTRPPRSLDFVPSIDDAGRAAGARLAPPRRCAFGTWSLLARQDPARREAALR